MQAAFLLNIPRVVPQRLDEELIILGGEHTMLKYGEGTNQTDPAIYVESMLKVTTHLNPVIDNTSVCLNDKHFIYKIWRYSSYTYKNLRVGGNK